MKDILKFLEALEANNNREWFDINRERYKGVRLKVLDLADKLIKEISKFYDLSHDLKPNECIFRINRDIRFKKDRTPYKTNMWIEISRYGRRHLVKSWMPCFYLHIQPWNQSFIAWWLYSPSLATASIIREAIDQKWSDFKKIINKIQKSKSFDLYNESLKTSPRWFTKDNANIELLKLKHWIFERPVSDKEMKWGEFEKDLVRDLKKLAPFVEWLQDRIDE